MQRRCGTCRYFEEAGIAGSGYCRHPLRRDLENMVFVRKSELACRDDRGKDLWEPLEAVVPEQAGDSPLVGIPRPPAARVDDDHGRTDTLAAIQVSARPPAPRPVSIPPVAPRPRHDAAAPGDRSASGLSPMSSGTSDDSRRRTPVEPPARETSLESDEDDEWGWRRGNRLGPPQGRPPAVRAATRMDRPRQQETPMPVPAQVSPPAEPHQLNRRTQPPLPRPTAENAPSAQVQSGSTERFALPDPIPAPSATGGREAPAEPAAVPEPDPLAQPPIQVTVEGQPIPQRCGTCRDFRPAEGGQRGWCNNRYAFEHPRMVQADDLSCASSIGNWWIPADAWWQRKADISHHGRPTPVVDEYLRRLIEERAAKRRAAR